MYRFKIRPRCLRNVERRDLSTTVLRTKVSMPVGISPTAMQRMAHPDGECASAKGELLDRQARSHTRVYVLLIVLAAEEYGIIFTLSTIATSSIEEVARAAPNGVKWFQLYIYNDR